MTDCRCDAALFEDLHIFGVEAFKCFFIGEDNFLSAEINFAVDIGYRNRLGNNLPVYLIGIRRSFNYVFGYDAVRLIDDFSALFVYGVNNISLDIRFGNFSSASVELIHCKIAAFRVNFAVGIISYDVAVFIKHVFNVYG